jgi:hypothetical protein
MTPPIESLLFSPTLGVSVQDDPFERAAQREAFYLDIGPARGAARPLIGIQLAWGVLLALHWWLAQGEGRPLRVHATIFVVALSLTVFAAVASMARARWSMLAVVAGWAPLLALHWVRAGDRTPGVTIHTAAFAFGVAFAIMTLFATPTDHRSPNS